MKTKHVALLNKTNKFLQNLFNFDYLETSVNLNLVSNVQFFKNISEDKVATRPQISLS